MKGFQSAAAAFDVGEGELFTSERLGNVHRDGNEDCASRADGCGEMKGQRADDDVSRSDAFQFKVIGPAIDLNPPGFDPADGPLMTADENCRHIRETPILTMKVSDALQYKEATSERRNRKFAVSRAFAIVGRSPERGLKMIFSRRILLVALGTTPHLTTATLSAVFKAHPEEMPTEIHVVTTRRGAECAREAYLDPENGLLAAFYRDYGLTPAAFAEDHIHVITNPAGEPLDDIRTQSESAGAADFIVSLVRGFCADPDSSLHVSIVGGRKSMGLLLGSAMTFFGRDRDRISHVLSLEEGPGAKPYPSPEELRTVPDAVSLGEIPFLRLRPILPEALLNEQYSYGDIVEASQDRLTERHPVRLARLRNKWRLTAEGIPLEAEKRAVGLYAWLLLRRRLGRGPASTSFGSLSLEEFFFLRLQFVMVLRQTQSENGYQTACRVYLGVEADRLERILQALRNQTIRDPRLFYQAFVKKLEPDEQKAFSEAAAKFANRISNPRSKFNDRVAAQLAEAIPDVTKRRLSHYLIRSTEQKDGCSYRVDLQPEDIELPEPLLRLLRKESDNAAEYWKSV